MEVRNFNIPDELVNVVLVVEEKRLFVHREVLSVWSPVFMAMFSGQFAEREKMEIPLPGKRYDDIIDMLKCIYPPISPVTGQFNLAQIFYFMRLPVKIKVKAMAF